MNMPEKNIYTALLWLVRLFFIVLAADFCSNDRTLFVFAWWSYR
jgi:hypothetical protein